jgi:hypothetical protein
MAEPVRVGALLAALPAMAERLAEARLLAAWPSIAGPAGARTRAEAIEQGWLQVAVDGSGWLHRLTLEEARLTARCREIASIRGIRFRLAPAGRTSRPEEAASGTAEGEVC